MNSPITLKQNLLSTIKKIAINKGINSEYPITDTMLSNDLVTKIDNIIKEIESVNPFPKPLLYGSSLLDGVWQLHYSTAREIRSLNKLPFGFKLKQVYQIINVNNASFFNIAFVDHISNLLEGYVKVTATFAPAIDENLMTPDKRLNVNFDKRYLSLTKIAGLKTPFFDPFKVFNANNPQGRIPSLDVTYIDGTLRIGRGGDGSLFVLSKQEKMV